MEKLENKLNYKKFDLDTYELINEIQNYSNKDYINQFAKKVQKIKPKYRLSILKAIEKMIENIGEIEYSRFEQNLIALTCQKEKFIRYKYLKEEVPIYKIKKYFNQRKILKKIGEHKGKSINEFPYEILDEMLTYGKKEYKKYSTMFDVIKNKNIESLL